MDTLKELSTLHFDTLSQAINKLDQLGYTEQFTSTAEGLVALKSKKHFIPDDLQIVKKFRFEGMSNPADNTLLMVIEANDGIRGTLVMAYGAEHFQDIDRIKEIEGHPRV